MIKIFGKWTIAALLAATVAGASMPAAAQETNKVAAVKNAKKARTTTNFSGKLGAIDKVAKTITLDDKTKRVFQVTSQTKIFKGDRKGQKPATLEDGTIGENVTGSWSKGDDGKMEIKNLYFRGTKETAEAAKPAAKKKKTTKPATPPAAPVTNAVPPDAAPPK